MKTLQDYIDKLNSLNFKEMYENDFFLVCLFPGQEEVALVHLLEVELVEFVNIVLKVFHSGNLLFFFLVG